MRKFITLFMTLVLFGLFSGSALADKVEVCEDIKFNPLYKGLYGLCNAYWNADERSRPRILENFYKKAGPDGPGMPGLDEAARQPIACPCWPAGEIDLGDKPDVAGCYVSADFLSISYDGNTVQFEVGGLGVNSCQYSNTLADPAESALFTPYMGSGLTTDELEACAMDVSNAIVEDFPGCLD